jgi:hypothetical protein
MLALGGAVPSTSGDQAADLDSEGEQTAGKKCASGAGGMDDKGAPLAPAKAKRAPREFEYVNIPKLYQGMRDVFARICPSCPRNPLHAYHYMRMMAVLIGLGGTDFSRGLPYIGPGTLWGMVCAERSVFKSLLGSYDLRKGLVNVGAARDSLACAIYTKKFATHFKKATGSAVVGGSRGNKMCVDSDNEDGSASGIQSVLDLLQASSLSVKTRTDLPSSARVDVTFRNINWLLQYWGCVSPVRKVEAGGGISLHGSAQVGSVEVGGAVGQVDEGSVGHESAGESAVVDGNCVEDSAVVSGEWDYSRCYPHPISPEYGIKYRETHKKGPHGKKKGKKKADCKQSSVQWLDEGCSSGDES